jgi:hypothetical protein
MRAPLAAALRFFRDDFFIAPAFLDIFRIFARSGRA